MFLDLSHVAFLSLHSIRKFVFAPLKGNFINSFCRHRSASIGRIANAVATANGSACASAETSTNGLNALARRAAAASSAAAAAARGAGDSLLPLRNQVIEKKLPELRLVGPEFRVRAALFDHTVRGILSLPHTSSALDSATQGHVSVWDSSALGIQQRMEATWANTVRKGCQRNCLIAELPRATF